MTINVTHWSVETESSKCAADRESESRCVKVRRMTTAEYEVSSMAVNVAEQCVCSLSYLLVHCLLQL